MSGIQIWSALQVVAAVIVGGCFLISGIAKLRDGSGTSATFGALGVPRALDRAWVHRSYPWIELVVGLGVLAAPAWVWWPFAVLAAGMLALLTALVWRVVATGDAVSCNCFGSVEPITWRTVVRNALFLLFALMALIRPLSMGSPLLTDLPARLPLVVSVLTAAGAAALLTTLAKGGRRTAPSAGSGATAGGNRLVYIPSLPITQADGTDIPLASLVQDGPVLLVFVKHGCSSCEQIVAELHDDAMIAERVRVRLVETAVKGTIDGSRPRLWDKDGHVAATLATDYSPAAILLAPDGTIPADPVYGADEIRSLVAALEQVVQEGTRSPGSPA
jgi:hypothetical protein